MSFKTFTAIVVIESPLWRLRLLYINFVVSLSRFCTWKLAELTIDTKMLSLLSDRFHDLFIRFGMIFFNAMISRFPSITSMLVVLNNSLLAKSLHVVVAHVFLSSFRISIVNIFRLMVSGKLHLTLILIMAIMVAVSDFPAFMYAKYLLLMQGM